MNQIFESTAVILSLLNPSGAGNDVIANSSILFQSPVKYASIEQCSNAEKPEFETLVDDAESGFYYTGTKACFETVPADQAGAWLAIWKASQNTGVRVQYDGQIVFLPTANYESCRAQLESLNGIKPEWETDLPLVLSGACI